MVYDRENRKIQKKTRGNRNKKIVNKKKQKKIIENNTCIISFDIPKISERIKIVYNMERVDQSTINTTSTKRIIEDEKCVENVVNMNL